MDDSSNSKYKKDIKKRNTDSISSYKILKHSNSQPFLNYNHFKKHRNYLFSKELNKHNSLLLPRVYDSSYMENGNKKYNKYETLSNTFNSSIINNKKNIQEKKIFDARKRLSRILDYKINSALDNKKLREKYDKKIMMAKMRKSLDEELKRERTLDDIRLQREFDNIEEKRQNMRYIRQKMLRDIKNQEIEDFENSYYNIPRIPPPLPLFPNPYIIPPQFLIPQVNNNNDTTGDLFRFLLIKKLLDNEKPLFPYPLHYLRIPYLYPPRPIIKIKKPKELKYKINYPNYPEQILIGNVPYIIKKKNKIKNIKIKRKSTIKSKGIPFEDPLENYLDMIGKLRKKAEPKSSENKKKKTSTKNEDSEENEEKEKNESEGNNEGGEEGGDEGGEGGKEGGEGGEGGEEGGVGDEGGEIGEEGGENGEEGGEGSEEGGDEGGEGGEGGDEGGDVGGEEG